MCVSFVINFIYFISQWIHARCFTKKALIFLSIFTSNHHNSYDVRSVGLGPAASLQLHRSKLRTIGPIQHSSRATAPRMTVVILLIALEISLRQLFNTTNCSCAVTLTASFSASVCCYDVNIQKVNVCSCNA